MNTPKQNKMKKLLIAFMLFPFVAFGQLNKDYIIWERKDSCDLIRYVGGFTPKHQIVITGGGNKQLYLDLTADSLKVSGDLKMDEAAIKFVQFVKQTYPREIFRLSQDSAVITFNGNRYIKEETKQNKN